MPELPEVEFARRLAEDVAVGRRIRAVDVADDELVIPGGPDALRRALKGRRVHAACRHGKYLWWALDRRPWPVFHFAMTGAFVVPGRAVIALETGVRPDPGRWPPRWSKLALEFEDGGRLAMINPRRFGRILLLDDPPERAPIAKLGFDPLLTMPDDAAFEARLASRRGVLKSLLLDQSFAAGVGNWMADEILYQARLDPHRTVPSLSVRERRALKRAMSQVVRTAVRANADASKFPRGWLFHRRWGKKGGSIAGATIEFCEIGGRTTAWVPGRQR